MSDDDMERQLADVRNCGEEMFRLLEQQRDEIVDLKLKLARVRELREIDYQMTHKPPRLGVWAAIRLWLRSFGVKEDQEEDCYDLRN